MYIIRKRFSDPIYRTGIICIALSLLLFCFHAVAGDEPGDTGKFILNFAITIFYFIYRWIRRKKADRESKIHHRFLFLILAFISAWALNREMDVFEDSATWFAVLMVISCVNYAAAAFQNDMPSWAKHTISFVNGISLLVFTYLSFYLLPIYGIGILTFLFFGVSLHAFIPFVFAVCTIGLQRRIAKRRNIYWLSFGAGMIFTVGIITIYVLQWVDLTQKINRAWQSGLTNKSGLPDWVAAAENIPATSLSKNIIKSTFVYTEPNNGDEFSFWRIPSRNIGEQRQHDPLIMVALLFAPALRMDNESRINILRTVFGMRHEISDRLWNGDGLLTDSVNTEVKIWPRCNMAYTEKTIAVKNIRPKEWNREQEAIYTFYMSEGSVVTSLSLWINGREEKGILTTKALADSAYQTIVGARRDPSVVHWQEGNTVSVRVFPVFSGESRIFKIGITSPMARVNGKLVYQNIRFKGPSPVAAKENIQVDFEQPVNDFQVPASFASKGKQNYKSDGIYNPDWGITINDPGLAGCSFSFDNNEYSLSPYHRKLSPVALTDLYLDINRSWTKNEFDIIIAQSADKNIYAYDNGIVKITDTNKGIVWDNLGQKSFSLFPLYAINDTAHALLITKNTSQAVDLDDIQESVFMKTTKQFLSGNGKINVFNLGDDLSLYLSSLKELRVLRYDNGNLDLLLHRLNKGLFADDIETDNRVVINTTDMIIEKNPGTRENSGPDHVMRLFSYNHIMQKLGKGLLFDRPIEDSLVCEARTAYVVSPVSSLVVLESQADYDRFNITDDANSLKNATLNSKGAVPEPHEWVLIGLVIITLVYIVRKRKLQPVTL